MDKNTSSHTRTVKVLIVDDDESVRDLVKNMLEGAGSFLVAEAADGMSAVQAFKDERPDAVLLDLRLPDMNGLETMRQLRALDPDVPAIIMTGYGDIPSAVESIKCGAYDFTVKPPDFKKLIPVLLRAVEKHSLKSERNAAFKSLTPREHEILRMTAEGLTCTKIAGMLSISPRTVETHRANLMQKLNIRNRSELIRFVINHGIPPYDKR